MRALVTGADGFVGRWLTRHLSESGDDVWAATGHRVGTARQEAAADLTDRRAVDELVEWSRPEVVYHLAAVAFGPDATADVGTAIDLNVRGTAFLLEASARMDRSPTVLIPSSAEVYGRAIGDEPIDEEHPTAPVNVYGATKLAQETIGLAFHRSTGLAVVVARAFNHIGPGQRASFVVPSFAGQLAEIAAGRGEPMLRVGNLDARRDFTDVRDVVRAYRMLVAGSHAGAIVNVASGRAVSVRAILDQLVAMSGLTVEISVDPSRMRANDLPVVVGDSTRLRRTTGWEPVMPLERTLADVWADALARHP